jgi:hypothetical protein
MGYDSWDEAMQFLKAGVEVVGPGVLDSVGKSLQQHVPGGITRERFGGQPPHSAVLAIDTREKLEQLFAGQPEPTPSEIRQILKLINGILAQYRAAFTKVAKQLPPDLGGRPVLIPDKGTQSEIRAEIQRLLDEDVEFEEALKRVAAKWRRKLNLKEPPVTTIHRIWYRTGVYSASPEEDG